MLGGLIQGIRLDRPARELAARFHATMAEAVVAVARLAGQERVVLTGGCFQNALLTTLAVRRLEQEGFQPYWHQRIPPNDGGVALGQLYASVVLPGHAGRFEERPLPCASQFPAR